MGICQLNKFLARVGMCQCFLLMLAFSGFVGAAEFKDSDIIFSRQTLNSFFDAAECLSLRAPLDEKRGFLTAKIMRAEWDVNSGEMKSKEWFSRYISAGDSDIVEILSAIKKYCPMTGSRLLETVRFDGYGSSETHPEVLADIVARVIAVEVLGEGERRRMFELDNKALGIPDFY